MQRPTPVTDILLLGAGHAHVEVLRRLAMRPVPGLRYTLLAREPRTPYSGMLPGLIRGDYTPDQAHIDCARLAFAAGARIVIAEAEEIDLLARRVHSNCAPPTVFDLLSIDVGGIPRMPPGAGIAVKPIGLFLSQLEALERGFDPAQRLVVVGGGAGGTELALALACRKRARIVLVSGLKPPLAGAPPLARAIVAKALDAAGIEVIQGEADGHSDRMLSLADGRQVPAARALWATGAVASNFLAASGLAWDLSGCVRVANTLRSVSHDFVFAAGDCAALEGDPRPKAGVWAVRAAAPLAENLVRAAQGLPLRAWTPQRSALVILGLGNGRAVAWRERTLMSGRLAWIWKDHVDRRWMRRYQRL